MTKDQLSRILNLTEQDAVNYVVEEVLPQLDFMHQVAIIKALAKLKPELVREGAVYKWCVDHSLEIVKLVSTDGVKNLVG